MILHALPFGCSFAVHVRLVERGDPFQVRWHPRGPGRRVVDPALGPNRRVPVLVHDDGTVQTEMVAILASLDGVHADLEWTAFVATELHAPILTVLYDDDAPAANGADAVARLLPPTLAVVEQRLASGPPDRGAAAYLFWALLLLDQAAPSLPRGPHTRAFQAAHRATPAVRHVLARETEARRVISAQRP
jgi:glutathione S-transferase